MEGISLVTTLVTLHSPDDCQKAHIFFNLSCCKNSSFFENFWLDFFQQALYQKKLWIASVFFSEPLRLVICNRYLRGCAKKAFLCHDIENGVTSNNSLLSCPQSPSFRQQRFLQEGWFFTNEKSAHKMIVLICSKWHKMQITLSGGRYLNS